MGGQRSLRVVVAASGPQNLPAARSPGWEDSGLPMGWWCRVPLRAVPPPQGRTVQSVEATQGQAAQNAASNSPCPTGAPTFQQLTPGSNLFASGSSPKYSKHVVTSLLHSQYACQLTDDHPKEAKDA